MSRESRNARRQADDLAREALGDRTGGLAPDVNVTSFWHRDRMEQHIRQGQPGFPHWLHFALTLGTSGLWGIGWWACWMGSKRRRYQRARRAQLVGAGLL